MDRFLLIERDGIITVRTDEGIVKPEQCLILPFVSESLLHLEKQGVKPIILSDQSKFFPGEIDQATVDDIHETMKSIVFEDGSRIEEILTCSGDGPGGDANGFPNPAIIQMAAQKYGFELSETYFITSDILSLQAGWAAGCKTGFVKTGKPYKTMNILRNSDQYPDLVTQDLLASVTRLFPLTPDDGDYTKTNNN
jgi:D-glycero-D-manno-heptose 1,7-bisphosphate phosphatase